MKHRTTGKESRRGERQENIVREVKQRNTGNQRREKHRINSKHTDTLYIFLESEKRHNESLLLFQQAVLVQPDDIGAHINIG